jgi:arylsulfatase
MIDHDKNVGEMLDLLDELGIAEDTFVQYSTDNGPHRNSWPDGGMTPFRSEKNTNWEGAFRVPMLVRWPGKVAAGSVSNGSSSTTTGCPLPRDGGAPDVVDKLKKGYKAIGRTYKNHIDGFSLLPYSPADEGEPAQLLLLHQRRRRHPRDALRQLEAGVPGAALPRDDAGLGGTVHAAADAEALQPAHGPLRVRGPDLEHRTTTGSCTTRTSSYAAQTGAAMFAETFKDFPPIQKPNSFTIDERSRR